MSEDNSEQSEGNAEERRNSARRSKQDRRRNVAPWKGEERRAGNRRKAFHRRGLPYGISHKTADTIDVLHDWLHENCHGKWMIDLDEGEQDRPEKSVEVLFEHEDDRKLFKREVGGG